MPAEEISRLRVRKYRDPQNTETTELPESLKALLAYDRDLLSNYNMPVIETLQRSIDKEGVIHSYPLMKRRITALAWMAQVLILKI